MDSVKARLRGSAVLGQFSPELVARTEDWKAPSNKLVVFVSSTFTDTDRERNVLQEKILPDLRKKGRAEGIEVVLVDMRWGVRDENTLDHQTWIACKRELLRCWKESAGLFFLSLQGDKYGYRPLPRALDRHVFEAALARHSVDTALVEAARKWYKQDLNTVGGEYVLQNLADVNEPEDWAALAGQLCELVNSGAAVPSASEEEQRWLDSGDNVLIRTFWHARMPPFIDRVAIESFSDAMRDSARIWYTDKDQDSRPMHDRLRLKGLADILYNDYWAVMGRMRDLLFSGAEFGQGSELVVGQSVTEWEVRFGLALPGAIERSHWMQRRFDGGVTLQQDPNKLLCDSLVDHTVQTKMTVMKEHMRLLLGDRVDESSVTAESYLAKDAVWVAYLEDFEARARCLFGREMASLVQLQRAWKEDGCGVGLGGEELSEMLHHVLWACSKISDFEGRQAELGAALALIQGGPSITRMRTNPDGTSVYSSVEACAANDILGLGDDVERITSDYLDLRLDTKTAVQESNPGLRSRERIAVQLADASGWTLMDNLRGPFHQHGCVSLCVVGKSGAGKTAFMAKLAQRLSQEKPDRPVLVRFCGTSRGSMTGQALVQSLCRQIEFAVSAAPKATYGYYDAVAHLHALVEKHAVILVIDSLDQLDNKHEARSQLSFLRGLVAHADTRIVVSCLPDETDELTGKNYFYGCDTRLRESNVKRVEIDSFTGSVALGMVERMLDRQGRRLSSGQHARLSADLPLRTTALHCRLVTLEASQWSSGTDPSRCSLLPHSVPGLIGHIFETIEGVFGRQMTRVALALVTFSRAGVSDAEMQDLLSLNDERVLNHVFQYSKPDDVRRFPLHVWLRLKGALEGLLVERENGCWQWYHRQLKEAAEARYAAGGDKQLAHELLGTYFGDLCGERGRQRLVAPQPLTLDGRPVWLPEAHVNQRRCVEAPFHLVAAGPVLMDQACRELCSVQLVSACCKTGQGFELLRALLALDQTTPCGAERVSHFKRWLLNDVNFMMARPQNNVVVSCTCNQPLSSWARLDMQAALAAEISQKRRVSLMTATSDELDSAWIRGISLGGKQDFDACYMILQGSTDIVISVKWSPDGRLLASCSGNDVTGKDMTVRVWDESSGQCLWVMHGHTEPVIEVCWSPTSRHIASSSWDSSVRVWDAETGECLQILQGHRTGVESVAYSPDGRLLASGGSDNDVRLWDTASWACVATLEGHTNNVNAVRWNPESSLLVSASGDKTVRVWDATATAGGEFECVATLQGHSGSVSSVDWSPDGRSFVSGSEDKTLRVWDATTHECTSTRVASSKVLAVAYSPDGGAMASGQSDGSVCLWDTAAAEGIEACVAVLQGHTSDVEDVSFSPCGRFLVSGSWDMSARMWDVSLQSRDRGAAPSSEQGTHRRRHGHGHTDSVLCIAWKHDSSLLASASADATVRLWAPNEGGGREVATLLGHGGAINSVAWSVRGCLASASKDAMVKLWDADTGECVKTLLGHSEPVVSVCFSPDGQRLASCSEREGTILLWDVNSGECSLTIGPDDATKKISNLAWSPDGKHIAAIVGSVSTMRKVAFWDVASGSRLEVYLSIRYGVCQFAWSPDGSRLLTGSMDTVRVFDTNSWACLHEQRLEYGACEPYHVSVGWSADGQRLVFNRKDNSVCVWDAVAWELVDVLRAHSRKVTGLAWSPDGVRIATCSVDRTVRLWDAIA